MTAIQDVQTALEALGTELTTVISDLEAAIANSAAANDPALEAVATTLNAMVSQLQAADVPPTTTTTTTTTTPAPAPVEDPPAPTPDVPPAGQ